MELRTTEKQINELLETYEEIRGSSFLKPEQQALLTCTPKELRAEGPELSKTAAGTSDEEGTFVRSLRATEAALNELLPRVEKFRRRLFEIDPVTEKPRYGPKSRARVRLLVDRHDFLCSQYCASFPEQHDCQRIQSEDYQRRQIEFQEQRQEQRRQEHSKQQELLKKEQEEHEDNEQEPTDVTGETTPAVSVDANIHPDGSIIIAPISDASENDAKKVTPQYNEASPASLLFVELQQQYDQRQKEQEQQEATKENARRKGEEVSQQKIAEEEARQKSLEAQRAAEETAAEEARKQRLHQQAEEARLRRRAQEEKRKREEREWLESIQKGAEGAKHYLWVLLQRNASASQGGKESDSIDPDRVVALQSLCTIFEQIQKHPEEVNRRKIKLSNPGFHQDIGRHEGGIELLIAAGFRPTMLPADNGSGTKSRGNNNSDDSNDEKQQEAPDIAFLISKEPNLEHDMDGWMTWFDLNKATLEILQTELKKVEGSKRSRR
eukprot:CAMPEP_0201194638 /NCGR_PEP_ID=MMETSP0851-20130426/149520_1 /ASSEMBLY_ACC=CAM_ASM_000631 /TAXON_ID=183588 /ORGANISM="Pseudo-nitzschia fraudulenta, Strain WWA7" /LENGTH=494 /DNA_ID=CAMNT_0047481341 /DNA_START=66 /DNA_END=1553 /DNA_ORIENTATION=-